MADVGQYVMPEDQRTIFVIGAALSISSSLFVALSYLCVAPLRKHPSTIIFWISLCDLGLALHWLLSAINPPSDPHSLSCIVHALGSVFFALADISWNAFLCLDLNIMLSRPLSTPQTRVIWYHVIAWSLATVACVVIGVNRHYGIGIDGTCCVLRGSKAEYWIIVPNITVLFFLMFSVVFTIMRLLSGLPIGKSIRDHFLFRQVMYLVVFVLLWIWPTIEHSLSFFTEEGDIDRLVSLISTVAVSCQAIILAGIRGAEPALVSAFRTIISNFKGDDEDEVHQTDGLRSPLLTGNGSGIGFDEGVLTPPVSEHHLPPTASISNQVSQVIAIELFHCILSGVVRVLQEGATDRGPTLKPGKGRDYSSTLTRKCRVSLVNTSWSPDRKQQSKNQEVSTTAFAPEVFADLRAHAGLTEQKLISSLAACKNEEAILAAGMSEGKSGSFFFRTYNNLFVLKTMSESECDVLLSRILPSYHDHVRGYPQTLLVKIFGVYKVRVRNMNSVSVVLMGNVFAGVSCVDKVFDLKGSTISRSASGNAGTLKDEDFNNTIRCLHINHHDREALLFQAEQDVTFLKAHNIMDYSLLLGISLLAKSHDYARGGSNIPPLKDGGQADGDDDNDDYKTPRPSGGGEGHGGIHNIDNNSEQTALALMQQRWETPANLPPPLPPTSSGRVRAIGAPIGQPGKGGGHSYPSNHHQPRASVAVPRPPLKTRSVSLSPTESLNMSPNRSVNTTVDLHYKTAGVANIATRGYLDRSGSIEPPNTATKATDSDGGGGSGFGGVHVDAGRTSNDGEGDSGKSPSPMAPKENSSFGGSPLGNLEMLSRETGAPPPIPDTTPSNIVRRASDASDAGDAGDQGGSVTEATQRLTTIIMSQDGSQGYCLGIIDFLQLYDMSKALEHKLKSIQYRGSRGSISAVNACMYADRFVNYLRKVFVCEAEGDDGDSAG